MLPKAAHPWTKTPALRLLLPFAGGIAVQWYRPLSLPLILTGGLLLLLLALLYQVLPLQKKYGLASLQGVVLSLLMGFIGAGAVYSYDIRNHPHWFGHHLHESKALVIRLEEPLVEKPATWKAVASVQSVYTEGKLVPASGKVLLYFKKDSLPPHLLYGSRLVVGKTLQEIKNTGNPGAFDYRRYSLFGGITHQAYLTPADYRSLPGTDRSAFKDLLFRSRQAIIGVLQAYIRGDKEQGLAEALLIGYRDDLDKGLVLAYSNTGVVHVIAISGLHVGLIYVLLLGLTRPVKRRGLLGVRLVMLLAGLWGFGVLAGASASVMRSVVMFSFLAGAEILDRRTSVYNTLALSAFLLLCYHPFWLWDLGFQLSYAAVAGILWLYRPIHDWLFFQNKALRPVWKMMAVTIAAQVFTTPLILYHFHQFPVLFLVTNMVAVPLSTTILFGEILLCALSFIHPAADVLGFLLGNLIGYMNSYIEGMDRVSFAVWSGISITALQATLLTIGVALAVWGLLAKKRVVLPGVAACAVLFLVLRSYSFLQAEDQRKLIVYNVPKHRAMDVIEGRGYHFIGDAAVQNDPLLHSYHLRSSRTLHRLAPVMAPSHLHSFQWQGRQVVLIDSTVRLRRDSTPRQVTLLILSGNPKVYMNTIAQTFRPAQVVADASVPRWKAALWKRDCDSLRIPFYDVAEKGAFVLSH